LSPDKIVTKVHLVGRRYLVLFLPLVLVAAACGGSENPERSSSPQAPAPTREAFVTKAEAICTEAWETVPAGARDAPPEKVFEMGIDTWSRLVGRLRRLAPPAAEKQRVDLMLTHFENAIRAARQLSTAEDEAVLAVFAGLFAQGQKGAAIAHSYGLDVCSLVPPATAGEEALAQITEKWQKTGENFTPPLLDP
jgi:hypothetical protein